MPGSEIVAAGARAADGVRGANGALQCSEAGRLAVRAHLDDFVDSYAAGEPRDEPVATEVYKSFTYDDLVARDRVNPDIIWLRDSSRENLDNLPSPKIIAQVIREGATTALEESVPVATHSRVRLQASSGSRSDGW